MCSFQVGVRFLQRVSLESSGSNRTCAIVATFLSPESKYDSAIQSSGCNKIYKISCLFPKIVTYCQLKFRAPSEDNAVFLFDSTFQLNNLQQYGYVSFSLKCLLLFVIYLTGKKLLLHNLLLGRFIILADA